MIGSLEMLWERTAILWADMPTYTQCVYVVWGRVRVCGCVTVYIVHKLYSLWTRRLAVITQRVGKKDKVVLNYPKFWPGLPLPLRQIRRKKSKYMKVKALSIWKNIYECIYFYSGTRQDPVLSQDITVQRASRAVQTCRACGASCPFWMWFFVVACYRGWWCTKIPLPKIDPKFLRRIKEVSESPPPPPPPLISFSGLARLSRLAADLVQNPHPRFQKSFLRAWVRACLQRCASIKNSVLGP